MANEHASPQPPPGCTLLTGATGLLGRYLLRDLLAAGHEVAVLARPAGGTSSAARIGALVDGWERAGVGLRARPAVVEGDVAVEGVGLSSRSRAWIGAHCARVVHGAAVVQFHARTRSGEPWRTNAQGARRVFALCRDLGIPDVHHVSTAYVSGDREGTILESELAAGQGFRNDYERSKFSAEEALWSEQGIAQKTVYRPGVIAGDARTGYTSSYRGLYVYLRALCLLLPRIRPDAHGVKRIPYGARLPLDAQRNIVPVDWVSRVIVRLLELPEARGRTYHLTPDHPVTTQALLGHVGSWHGDDPVVLCEPGATSVAIPRIAHAWRMVQGYEAYGAGEPAYDASNRERFAPTEPCPALDEATVHRYLDYAERDGWGRQPAAGTAAWT